MEIYFPQKEKSMYKYNRKFYEWIDTETYRDPEIIMKCIIEWIKPKTIVDFGCGEGLWLSIAKKLDNNISVQGFDGEYIDRNRLKISINDFVASDLSQKILIKEKFDLAISTEVAEHIEEKYCDNFIDNITSASDFILFSAAIPGQCGVNHVNEQWQSYWINKFERRGYFVDLSIRNYFWSEIGITSWRKQNLLFFSKSEQTSIAPNRMLYDVVHPNIFNNLNERFIDAIEQLDMFIYNFDECEKLNSAITNIRKECENIVIYPFGRNGRLFKKILNNRYGIKELAIVDNYEYLNDKKIISARMLNNLREKFIVVDTCSNPEIHNEVLRELKRFVKDENIYSIFNI